MTEHEALLRAQETVKLPKQEWVVNVFEQGKWQKKFCNSEEEAYNYYYGKLNAHKQQNLSKPEERTK